MAVADLGEAGPPFFLAKMRPEGPKKIFLETSPPPPLSQGLAQGLDDRARPYLKVWMRHCMGHFS